METNNPIPEYISVYLRGAANEEQKSQATAWLKSPENLKVYLELKKINSLTTDLNMLQQFDVKVGKRKVLKKFRNNRSKIIAAWVQRVAAILFIPVLFGGIWYYIQQNKFRRDLDKLMVTQEIVTQPGTKTHLFLPDSTEVWLNSSSTIRFPSVFSGRDRRVTLIGQAYFKVFHNKQKPFIVNTSFLEVEALGTSFDLSAYTDDYKISTTLEEGKVKVTDKKDTEKVMYLNPDNQINLSIADRLYSTQKVRVKDVIAWKDGILVFNQTPFYEVATKLGRWFNADIQITDKSIANYRFTGTFTSENLDQVMELLTISAPIAFSSSKRKALEDKSFTKQEIRIWGNPNAKINLK